MSKQRSSGDFEIIELGKTLTEKQMNDLVDVTKGSLAQESMFQLRIQELSDQQKDAWIRKYWLQEQIARPDFRSFAVQDHASDKLIGYTSLSIPAVQADLKERHDRIQKDLHHSVGPKGQAFLEGFGSAVRAMASKHGFDPERHFHKRNTLILPEYHRRGLGTWLTTYCNEIADQAGQPTYCNARPKAWKMLESTGFQLLDEASIDATPFGGNEVAVVRYFKREPHAIGAKTA